MIDRAALIELMKTQAGLYDLGKKYSWRWDIEADILTVRHYDGKPDETIPTLRQWRLTPIGDGA